MKPTAVPPEHRIIHLRCQSKVTIGGRRVRCDFPCYHSGTKHRSMLPWTRHDPRGAQFTTWQGVESGKESYFDPKDTETISV